MALSDFLKNLSSNVFTPGVEQLISSVPMLVGSYESGRGKSIGRPLEMLGQLGMTNAANRQAESQKVGDISGRLQSLAAQGLLPKDFYSSGEYEAIAGGQGPNATGMSPEAADRELTDVENRQVASQAREQSLADAEQKWTQEHQKPFPLVPGGSTAFKYAPDHSIVRAPEFDAFLAKDNVKKPFDLYAQGMKTGDFKPWNAYQASLASQQLSTANAKVSGRVKTMLDAKMSMMPYRMVPELKGYTAIDRDTMRPAPDRASAKQIFDDPEHYTFADRKTATETIPNMAAGRNELIKLAQYSAKVLPHGTGNKLNDWATTYANRWKIPFKALSGGVNEAMFGAERTAAAMQLQKAFTGSTRPVNLVEFTRITGDAHDGPMTAKDIDAVLPTSRDTYEVAQAKLSVLKDMFDNKLAELNMNSPAPGYYSQSIGEAMKAAGSAPEPAEAPADESGPATTTPTEGEDL